MANQRTINHRVEIIIPEGMNQYLDELSKDTGISKSRLVGIAISRLQTGKEITIDEVKAIARGLQS